MFAEGVQRQAHPGGEEGAPLPVAVLDVLRSLQLPKLARDGGMYEVPDSRVVVCREHKHAGQRPGVGYIDGHAKACCRLHQGDCPLHDHCSATGVLQPRGFIKRTRNVGTLSPNRHITLLQHAFFNHITPLQSL